VGAAAALSRPAPVAEPLEAWSLLNTNNGFNRGAVRGLVREWLDRDKREVYVARAPDEEERLDQFVLHPTERPYSHACYGSIIFGAAVERAGLPGGTTSHALRHHFASVLLAAGESVVAVAELLGHENAALVLSTYGHLLPNWEDRMRRAIDSAWSVSAETEQERNQDTR